MSSAAPLQRYAFALAVLAGAASGCTSLNGKAPSPAAAPIYEDTPVPTVPPVTPAPAVTPAADVTPAAVATPLPTRPIGKAEAKAKPGAPIGPIITFFGAARADGLPVEPESVDRNGVPTFLSAVGSGFILVLEAKPGTGGFEVGRRTFVHVPDNPSARPDVEILVSRPLGDGSKAVCDRRPPQMGGVPAVNPANFDETQAVADAMNDLACRFETFNESEMSCTLDANGNYKFAGAETSHQYCVIIARSFSFPEGTTEVTVRVKDVEGNPGPPKKLRIKRPPAPKN